MVHWNLSKKLCSNQKVTGMNSGHATYKQISAKRIHKKIFKQDEKFIKKT